VKSGILNLYKEAGMTSHDAVARVRRLLGTRKVGHTGTLDPQATGVLPILIGNAVKACDLVPHEKKTYRARVRFGLATDTEDIWGRTVEKNGILPEKEAFSRAVEAFRGAYDQIPPMMSAVKIGGKKLYEYARAGEEIDRPARRVTVHEITLLSFEGEEAELCATVSRGTYIRTLLCDICKQAGVLGAMSALERVESGIFSAKDSVTLSRLEELTPEARYGLLLPTERLFEEEPVLTVEPFYFKLLRNGCAVLTAKLSLSAAAGERFRLYENGCFYALAAVFETEEGLALKIVKRFSDED